MYIGVGRIFVNGRLSNKELSRVQFSPKWMLGLRFGKYFSGGLDYKMTGLLDELQFFDCVMSDEKIGQLANHCQVASCGGHGDGGDGKEVIAEGMFSVFSF